MKTHDLLMLKHDELAKIYAAAPAGPYPQGASQGIMLAARGRSLSWFLAAVAGLFWQGKIIDALGTMTNRILGMRFMKGKVGSDQSWFDGKPSWVIDYRGTFHAFTPVRDEIREIAPKVYLGKSYFRTKGRPFFTYFALDFSNNR